MKTGHTNANPTKAVDDFMAHFERDIATESGMICTRWWDVLRDCARYPIFIKELVEKQIENSHTLYDFPYWRGRDLMHKTIAFCRDNDQLELAKRLETQLRLLTKGASLKEIEAARIEKRPSMARRALGFFRLG